MEMRDTLESLRRNNVEGGITVPLIMADGYFNWGLRTPDRRNRKRHWHREIIAPQSLPGFCDCTGKMGFSLNSEPPDDLHHSCRFRQPFVESVGC